MASVRKSSLAFIAVALISSSSFGLEPQPTAVLPNQEQVYLLGANESARAILGDDDSPFFSLLTPLDMEIRMGEKLDARDHEKNQERFKRYVQDSVRDWTSAEKTAFLDVLRSVDSAAQAISPNLVPARWKFIKTTGMEEGGACYTRGDCIIVPQESLSRLLEERETGALAQQMLHETFHLYCKNHPEIRVKLYEAIGFSRLGSVILGGHLAKRRITNPDGADYGWAINLKDAKGESYRAIAVTYSKFPEYNPEVPGLFSYVTFGLFEVRATQDGWKVVVDQRGNPLPLDPEKVRGFFEQTGRNTSYIIHPEEILADNVALLALARAAGKPDALKDVPDPEVLSRIEALLKN